MLFFYLHFKKYYPNSSFFFNFYAAKSWQLGFQDSATPIMEGVVDFHHDLFTILVFVCIFVFYMLAISIYEFGCFDIENLKTKIPVKTKTNPYLEVIWTSIPACILMYISIPSFALLYAMDEIITPLITLKVVGRQWYWHYEYSDYTRHIRFDSYMLEESDLKIGQLRLLETDKKVILPIKTHIRLLITAADVLHSWAIPSFGIKLDACPGRLNQTAIFINRKGIFYGQCSEICGVNHGFMPITVAGVSVNGYTTWISKFIK